MGASVQSFGHFSIIFHISTYRVIVGLFRFNLNVVSERVSVVGVIAAVDPSTGAAVRGIAVPVDVLAGSLPLLVVGRRRVFCVNFDHLDCHPAVKVVLKKQRNSLESLSKHIRTCHLR